MLRVLSMVSGSGTNLQAIIDSVKNGMITNTELVGVISNNKNAYALTRAKENGIDAKCISPKDYESREVFNQELLNSIHKDIRIIRLNRIPGSHDIFAFIKLYYYLQKISPKFILFLDVNITVSPNSCEFWRKYFVISLLKSTQKCFFLF